MEKTCEQCDKKFLIRDQDLGFYDMMKSPLPLYCPDCRVMRRLAFRNERKIYRRNCDLCKESIVSLYPEGTVFPVYCHHCWWSDKWDPRSYALDYDLSRSFFEQFKALQDRVPRIALLVIDSVRSDYTNNAGMNKDCYFIFASENNEDCLYSRLIMRSRNCSDCAFAYDCEFCYECIDVRQCFKCLYSEECQSSSDLIFCYDMRNSNNCIFSTHGRNVSYLIYNKKVTKEEFEAKKKEIFSSYENLEKAKEEFKKLKQKTFIKNTTQNKCNNVTGNYMHNCHDGVRLFDVSDTKNCSYMADSMDVIDSMDCNNYYIKCERQYDMMGVLGGSNNKHGVYIMYSTECEYSDSCYHSQSLFGCIRLNKESYCILNKKYSKEEYYILKDKIIEAMKKEGVYGQFFPPALSTFGYNETLAYEYYPMSRDEAIAKGYRWQEKSSGIFGKETIREEDMPESIDIVADSILDDILICKTCGKNFRIIQTELEFYRRMKIPLPHYDFECRHKSRMDKRAPRSLRKGMCLCKSVNHIHKGDCREEFFTPYGESNILYCDSCYKQEVL